MCNNLFYWPLRGGKYQAEVLIGKHAHDATLRVDLQVVVLGETQSSHLN